MNSRQLSLVWLTAVALVVVLSIGPILWADRGRLSHSTPIVVIGSSLTAYAVPAAGGAENSLLNDRRPHVRIALPRMTEGDLLEQLDLAVDQRSAVILIEANPLLVDFADRADQRACDGWSYMVRNKLAAGRRRVSDAYRWFVGAKRAELFRADPSNISSGQIINPATIRRIYPFKVRLPCDEVRLGAAVARARTQATRVVLFIPPRSLAADRLLGAAVKSELDTAANELAARYGIEIFVPQGNWENGEFVDHAHLNLRGRKHFLQELRRWWAQAR